MRRDARGRDVNAPLSALMLTLFGRMRRGLPSGREDIRFGMWRAESSAIAPRNMKGGVS
jgi:hypothetical protein